MSSFFSFSLVFFHLLLLLLTCFDTAHSSASLSGDSARATAGEASTRSSESSAPVMRLEKEVEESAKTPASPELLLVLLLSWRRIRRFGKALEPGFVCFVRE